jgi:hypothetical protein
MALKLRQTPTDYIPMTLDPPNVTKADVFANYVAAQDLSERLARQIEINQALRDENAALATRPCLACEVVHPAQIEALTDRADMFEAELRGAICMLDLVKAEEGNLYVGTVEQFIRDRIELNETFQKLTNAQKA